MFFQAKFEPLSVSHPQQVGSVHVKLAQAYEKQGRGIRAATSDEVKYTFTITNNGLLSVYDIGIKNSDLHDKDAAISCTDINLHKSTGVGNGVYTGLASYPDNALAPAAWLTCTTTDTVSQAEVREKKSIPMTRKLR